MNADLGTRDRDNRLAAERRNFRLSAVEKRGTTAAKRQANEGQSPRSGETSLGTMIVKCHEERGTIVARDDDRGIAVNKEFRVAITVPKHKYRDECCVVNLA